MFKIWRIVLFPVLYVKQFLFLNRKEKPHHIVQPKQEEVAAQGVASTVWPDGSLHKHPKKTVKEARASVADWNMYKIYNGL